jgi:hypothetical protein
MASYTDGTLRVWATIKHPHLRIDQSGLVLTLGDLTVRALRLSTANDIEVADVVISEVDLAALMLLGATASQVEAY